MGEISSKSMNVLNYLKKHNCSIKMSWSYGIQVYRVVKDGKELSYPRINEDIFCDILKDLKGEGDYQKGMIYNYR